RLRRQWQVGVRLWKNFLIRRANRSERQYEPFVEVRGQSQDQPLCRRFRLSPLVRDAAFSGPNSEVVVALRTAVHLDRPACAHGNEVKPRFDFSERLMSEGGIRHRNWSGARIEQIDCVVVARKLIPHSAEDPGFIRVTRPPIEPRSESRAKRTAEALAVAE